MQANDFTKAIWDQRRAQIEADHPTPEDLLRAYKVLISENMDLVELPRKASSHAAEKHAEMINMILRDAREETERKVCAMVDVHLFGKILKHRLNKNRQAATDAAEQAHLAELYRQFQEEEKRRIEIEMGLEAEREVMRALQPDWFIKRADSGLWKRK
jgi:hypothetical protein